MTRTGDLWLLGRHRLICGDARDRTVFERLMGDERADLVFTDPPYNVPIDGHATGLGPHPPPRVRHGRRRDVVAPSPAFCSRRSGNAAQLSQSGAIAFVCMDWRHMGELLTAGQAVFSELKNLCVWNKTNGGMGSFYRSKHELVFVFKVGEAATPTPSGSARAAATGPMSGTMPGSIAAGRPDEDLAMHPTVKPVALVADAIKDCSQARRDRARSVWRLRHDADRGAEDRAPGAADRMRPALLRHHHAPLRAGHRQRGHSRSARMSFEEVTQERLTALVEEADR